MLVLHRRNHADNILFLHVDVDSCTSSLAAVQFAFFMVVQSSGGKRRVIPKFIQSMFYNETIKIAQFVANVRVG